MTDRTTTTTTRFHMIDPTDPQVSGQHRLTIGAVEWAMDRLEEGWAFDQTMTALASAMVNLDHRARLLGASTITVQQLRAMADALESGHVDHIANGGQAN